MTPTEKARKQRLAHLQDEMGKGFDLDARDKFEYYLLSDLARLTAALAPVPPDRERLATALLRYAADMEEPEVVQDLHAAALALRTPAPVPPDRELAEWLTADADLLQGRLPGIAHRIRSAAAALRTAPAEETKL